MGFLSKIFSRKVEVKETKEYHQRGFMAAIRDRLTDDWNEIKSLNVSIRDGLETLRGRSRDLSVNNEYARRYLKLLKVNIVGPDGIAVSVLGMNADNSVDPISEKIELKFWKWGMDPRLCSVNGQTNWPKIQELAIETVARDGEALVWFRRGPQFGPYAFQIQLLDIDHLDVNFNSQATNGNRIVQSVELDSYDRPVAYWIWKNNPSDTLIPGTNNTRIRIVVEDLKHLYDPERVSQVRGFPWMTPGMVALQHLVKFREATLIAARLSANKQVYYSQGDQTTSYDDDEVDDEGNLTFESKPGTHEILPRGWEVHKLDFAAPTEQLESFQKNILRGVAAGLGVSYNSLASDLESVNYSSARFGALEDQAMFRSTQHWFINVLIRPVFEEWLKMQLLTNNWGLNLPYSRFEKFSNAQFRPRSWSSVDPVKDINADRLGLEAGLKSWSDVIAKSGRDPEEVMQQIAKDKRRMEELGITPAFLTKHVTAQGFSDEEQSAMNKKPDADA